MASHSKRHHIVVEDYDAITLICVVCRGQVVEIESAHFSRFYRHKPSGYKWGDTARRYKQMYESLRERVKSLPPEYHNILRAE